MTNPNITQIPPNLRLSVEPAIKWLNENANPYSYILITPTGAELLESNVMIKTEKHLKD